MTSPDLTPERFFNEVFNQIQRQIMSSDEARFKAQFSPQIVRGWAYKLGRPGQQAVHVSLDLKRVAILESDDICLALVMGRFPRRLANDEPNWGLQYGAIRSAMLPHYLEPMGQLRCCIDPYSGHGGDFYVYPADSRELWGETLMDNKRSLGIIDLGLMNNCIKSIQHAIRIVAVAMAS